MFGDSCGPSWLPSPVRRVMFGWFFEADCARHDEGYREGGSELRRWECDYKFFRAMIRDATIPIGALTAPKVVASVGYYAAVMAFGWSSFSYKTNV